MAWKFEKGAAGAAQPALAPAAAPAPVAQPAVNAAPPPPVAAPMQPAAAPVAQSAASLPPVPATPPAAPAGVAPATAAPAPSRRRSRTAAPAPATAAPVQQVPGQQTLPVAGVPAVATPAPAAANGLAVPQAPVPTTAYSGFLGVIVPTQPVRTVAQAAVEGKTQPGEPNVFPTIFVTGGAQGGMFDKHEMNEEGASVDLPVGRDPIHAILLGYRLNLYLWPEAAKEGQKNRPRSTAHVPAHEFDAGNAIQLAFQRYQMRNRDLNAKYDQFGHPSCEIELLLYDAVVGPFCLRSTGSYDALIGTAEALQGTFPGGQPQPTPVVIAVRSEDRTSKRGKPWKEHIIGVQQYQGPEMAEHWSSFQGFYQQHANNADLIAAFTEWNKNTITSEQLAQLQAIANA